MNKWLRWIPRSLSPRQQWFAGGGCIVAAMLLLARIVYLPLLADIGYRYARLQELRVKLADVRVLKNQQPAQRKALAQTKARYQALRYQVGEGQSIARILETLGQQAKRHRLELVAVQPPVEEETPRRVIVGADMTLRELPLSVQLTGRYRQAGEFLGEFYHAPFLSSVRQLKIAKPQADRATIQADVALVVYLAEAGARR